MLSFTFTVIIELLDVFMSRLELLDDFWILGLEKVSFSLMRGLVVVEIFLILQHQPLSGSVLGSCAEQSDDFSVGNIGSLLLLPGGGELVKYHPAVDSEPPATTELHSSNQ